VFEGNPRLASRLAFTDSRADNGQTFPNRVKEGLPTTRPESQSPR